jgi:hypothetical protein
MTEQEGKFDNYLENHYIHRSNWLRAAVLGANDGILSTASIAMELLLQAIVATLLYWQQLLAWLPVLYRWLRVSMFQSALKRMLSKLILRVKSKS